MARPRALTFWDVPLAAAAWRPSMLRAAGAVWIGRGGRWFIRRQSIRQWALQGDPGREGVLDLFCVIR